MKKPNEPVPPPWPEDMEEALRAQLQWLENQKTSASSGRSSLRFQGARLFVLVAFIALLLALSLFILLKVGDQHEDKSDVLSNKSNLLLTQELPERTRPCYRRSAWLIRERRYRSVMHRTIRKRISRSM